MVHAIPAPLAATLALALALAARASAAPPPAAGSPPPAPAGGDAVKVENIDLTLPTYRVAPPDPDPRFYDGRVYQGARASFYPSVCTTVSSRGRRTGPTTR